jgi:hypothetical protein
MYVSAGWAAVVVNALTLVVLGGTLYWVWRYTQAADKAALLAEPVAGSE